MSSVDILIFGGAAGGGKTFALLLEPTYWLHVPGFNCVTFRRTYPQITNPGGLWDDSSRVYPLVGGDPHEGNLEWTFRAGSRVVFAHLQHEKNKYDWKGAQIALLQFDQLEDFTESQFFYLTSRNRSACGVRPYVRASCNPDPDSWVATFIAWWIDQDSGYPIPERAGVPRWFVRDGREIVWGEDPEVLRQRYPTIPPRSVTFIPSKLEDNPALTTADPNYLASLMALDLVERERLLGGNWKIRPEAGKVFNRSWFPIVEAAPSLMTRVRYWDKAGTEGGGAETAGVLMGWDEEQGIFYIEDAVHDQWSSLRRERVIGQVAESDGYEVEVVVEQEPGSGGKESAEHTIRGLAGYVVKADRPTGDKIERARPLSAQAEAGNVRLVRGEWNEHFLKQAHNFGQRGLLTKSDFAKKKDMVDAATGAFNWLTRLNRPKKRVPIASESYFTG